MNPHWNEKLIDGRQLMLLLVLGRLFSMMTYSPGKEAVPGSVTLVAQLTALGLELLLLLPTIWVLWHFKSGDLLGLAYRKNTLTGQFCAILGLTASALQAAHTLTVQADFLSGTIYRLPSRIGLLLALWAGVVYAVWLGLESFSRLSMGVFLVFGLLVIALLVQSLPRIDLTNLHSPFEDGIKPILQGTFLSVGRCGELGAAVLLFPTVRKNAGRWSARAALVWTGFTLLISFLTLTVLGNFAALRSYPVYTLALSGSERSVFGRLDALLLLVWIFLAVIRGAMYLWLGARCVFLLSGKSPLFCIGAAGVLALVMCALSSVLGQNWESPLLWGGVMLSTAMGIPILAALSPKSGRKRL